VYEALEGNGYTGSASGNTLTADGITVSGNVYGATRKRKTVLLTKTRLP
jgi:hypothetical protein